jgi:hypothetical protein
MAFTFARSTQTRLIGIPNLAVVRLLFPPGLSSISQDISLEEISKTRKTLHILTLGTWKHMERYLTTEIESGDNLFSQDMAIDSKNTSAVATKKQIILTKTTPCALVEAQAVLSKQWGLS